MSAMRQRPKVESPALRIWQHVFTKPGQSFRDTLAELENFLHDPTRAYGWRMTERRTNRNAPCRAGKSAGDARQGGQGLLRRPLDRQDGPHSIQRPACLAGTPAPATSRIDDLVNHRRPVSLYLVVPPSDKIRLRPLIRLIFTMIVNRLTERMDFEGSAQKRNRHRLLFMVDEFPSLKRMEIFADALVLHGRLWTEGLSHHSGHPADRGRIRPKREHRFQLPRTSRVRAQPVRHGRTAVEDDRDQDGPESELQLLGFPPGSDR